MTIFVLLAVTTGASLLLLRKLVVRPDSADLVREGEAIFWGRGRCSGCHSIANVGGSLRCPDLGDEPGAEHGFVERAASRVAGLSAAEYVVQSLLDPDAVSLPDYPARLMPPPMEPPISLSGEDVLAVSVFLLAAADTPDIAGQVRAAQEKLRVRSPALTAHAVGDPVRGMELYRRMKCASCHEDARLAPPLDGIGAVQGRAYLIESIVDPDAVVVFAPGNRWRAGSGSRSRMPSYAGLLSAAELDDLAAYLATFQAAGFMR